MRTFLFFHPLKAAFANQLLPADELVFYIDAQRDVVDDIRNKKSFFGKATSNIKLPNDKAIEIEG